METLATVTTVVKNNSMRHIPNLKSPLPPNENHTRDMMYSSGLRIKSFHGLANVVGFLWVLHQTDHHKITEIL